MSDDTYELPPMCVTPDGRCEEGDGPPGADSSTPRDTQGESPQGEALNGQARHAGNAETRWRALTSYPDFCQVGDKIVGFDSSGPLGNPVNYSPNVITAGQRTYRVGDLCQGTEGNAGSGVGSGTSQGSGHVLFLTGHDNVKANGQPVVRDGSECMVNCNAAGAGGAKGYVHTNTESVNSQPEESSEPLSEAELFQQQGEANLERVGELRDALNDNPNGKTAAEAEALYAEVEQLVGETRAQQDALMDALREGRISGNDYIESSFEVDEAANRAAGMQQEAERQVRYTSESGRNIRAAGVFVAEAATPYGTVVDIRDTIALWGEGRYLAASGMTLLTAVSVIPGVGLLRKADDAIDVARGGNRAGDLPGGAGNNDVSTSQAGEPSGASGTPSEGVQVQSKGKENNGEGRIRRWEGPADYSSIPDPQNLSASPKPTPRQVSEMKRLNREHNGGVMRSDMDGTVLVDSQKSMKGVTPPSNEAQIDHIIPVDKGGTRTSSNLQILSRQQNRDKWNN